jgi:hypothetical protein
MSGVPENWRCASCGGRVEEEGAYICYGCAFPDDAEVLP